MCSRSCMRCLANAARTYSTRTQPPSVLTPPQGVAVHVARRGPHHAVPAAAAVMAAWRPPYVARAAVLLLDLPAPPHGQPGPRAVICAVVAVVAWQLPVAALQLLHHWVCGAEVQRCGGGSQLAAGVGGRWRAAGITAAGRKPQASAAAVGHSRQQVWFGWRAAGTTAAGRNWQVVDGEDSSRQGLVHAVQ